MQPAPHSPVIMWFRQDLRLEDNPALFEANKRGDLIPIYILDDINSKRDKMGAASRFWLHHALDSLNRSMGGKLELFSGDPLKLLPQIMEMSGAKSVFWNRCYEPWRIARDAKLKRNLDGAGYEVFSTNGSLLWEPWEIKKKDGSAIRYLRHITKKVV